MISSLFPSREQLRAAIERLDVVNARRRESFRAPGRAARAEGLGLDANPYSPGAWIWTVWLEGWSGTEAPERTVRPDGAFNMTPSEELARRFEWLEGLGVPEDQRAQALAMFRAGYRPECFGSAQ